MPRQPRRKSESGIYHVMIRGIDRQTIFFDSDDHTKFLDLLALYKDATCTLIYAYCLMQNHVHLLVRSSELSNYMRKVGAGYASWYNWKYDRVGSLFQDRFKSVPVDKDEYFLTVLRYIHLNPTSAKIVAKIEEHKYNSYCNYITHHNNGIVDIDFALNMLPLKQFINYHNESSSDVHMDILDNHRVNDETAREIILAITGINHNSRFQLLDVPKRNHFLKEMKQNGLTIRQIERLTGLGRGIISNA